jgi:RNA polymerase sigma factor (sigma-70 family)
MLELDDNALLRDYGSKGSEEAFAELVSRHLNKVYSTALRHTGNTHQAEEIAQSVFVLLAKKASQLEKGVILEGWLYQTARLTALTTIRGEIRRARREEEAHLQTITNQNDSDVWTQIEPLLDAAMESLNEIDRHAVVLRFFYGKSMREVGVALGGSEGAATTRLHRSLEKLRQFFVEHGVSSTTDAIEGAMAVNSVQAAPAALTKAITAAALSKGVAASGGPVLATWLKTTMLGVIVANAFLSQKIVATHFNLAGNPDYWMTQSHSALVWLLAGAGFPLFFVGIGYSVRFGSISRHTFNIPNRDYWLAPERIGETAEYVFHRFLWMALFGAIFMLAQMLLQIQANLQNPSHLSTPTVLATAGCFIAATTVVIGNMLRHFMKAPGASSSIQR